MAVQSTIPKNKLASRAYSKNLASSHASHSSVCSSQGLSKASRDTSDYPHYSGIGKLVIEWLEPPPEWLKPVTESLDTAAANLTGIPNSSMWVLKLHLQETPEDSDGFRIKAEPNEAGFNTKPLLDTKFVHWCKAHGLWGYLLCSILLGVFVADQLKWNNPHIFLPLFLFLLLAGICCVLHIWCPSIAYECMKGFDYWMIVGNLIIAEGFMNWNRLYIHEKNPQNVPFEFAVSFSYCLFGVIAFAVDALRVDRQIKCGAIAFIGFAASARVVYERIRLEQGIGWRVNKARLPYWMYTAKPSDIYFQCMTTCCCFLLKVSYAYYLGADFAVLSPRYMVTSDTPGAPRPRFALQALPRRKTPRFFGLELVAEEEEAGVHDDNEGVDAEEEHGDDEDEAERDSGSENFETDVTTDVHSAAPQCTSITVSLWGQGRSEEQTLQNTVGKPSIEDDRVDHPSTENIISSVHDIYTVCGPTMKPKNDKAIAQCKLPTL